MIEKEILHKVDESVFDLLKNDSSGHDYYHIKRVVKNTQLICIAKNLNDFYPVLLAYLHDVGDYKLHNGIDKTEFYVKEILKGLIDDAAYLEKLIQDIQKIGFKGGFNTKSDDLNVWIVQDADKLDAMGAIGIARAFAYGGSKNRMIHDPTFNLENINSIDLYISSKSPTIQHFYDKLLQLKDLIKTEKGKEMANERHEFMLLFLSKFYEEWKV